LQAGGNDTERAGWYDKTGNNPVGIKNR